MGNYSYVNTRLGTFNTRRFSNGNVLALTAVPHGMASFTIQNEKSWDRWFYSPLSKSFEGIRLTHRPSPWMGDYGNLIITGQRGALALEEDRRWSAFDNKHCILQPCYMKGYVYRDRYTFELAPTNSGAIVRFSFSDVHDNRINLIGDADTVFEYERETGWVTGYTTASANKFPCELREYFAFRLNVPFTAEFAKNAISLLTHAQIVECVFATSFLSVEQAKRNFELELAGKTLEAVRMEGEEAWERYLSRIQIEDENEERKAVFYTCMFHAFLWPRRFYEFDETGKPFHLNFQTGKPAEGILYVDNGFWDTYRTLFPYLSLMDRTLYRDMAEGFLNYYKESGWLPKWLSPGNVSCMPGMLIEAVMADAIVKDIVTGELAEEIFAAILKDGEASSAEEGCGRTGGAAYRKYGYVPYIVAKESVNETLDCAYGDYCIAQAAAKLGKHEIAARYYGYAKNYRNLFDAQTGFMRGKDEQGNFRMEPFDPFCWGGDYTEGSAWQNSFGVYHDFEGLDALYGGKLTEKLDELFAAPNYYTVGSYDAEIHEMSEMADEGSQCAISNQPSFHIPYIYSELGNVRKTAEVIAELAKLFTNSVDGFPGDEDNGSLTSWFLLTCMGLYQVSPSRPDFTVSLPLFKKMTVQLDGGNTLVIERDRYDLDVIKNRIGYSEVMQGGNLAELLKK